MAITLMHCFEQYGEAPKRDAMHAFDVPICSALKPPYLTFVGVHDVGYSQDIPQGITVFRVERRGDRVWIDRDYKGNEA